MKEGAKMGCLVLGEKIRAARKAMGFSSWDLGDKLDPPVSGPAVCKWERGITEPNISHMIQLRDILGIDIAGLFIDSEAKSRIEYYYMQLSEPQQEALIAVAKSMLD